MGNTLRLVYDEILRFLRALVIANSTFEIRVLRATRAQIEDRTDSRTLTLSGYFNFLKAAVDEIERTLSGATFEGVFVTLNPLSPAVFARATNRFKVADRGGSSTTDADVLKRNWLFFDVDSVRPSGISAIGEEKNAANLLASSVVSFLAELGWPEPVTVDSGNGFHVAYRVDLPADDGGLTRSILKTVAERFDNKQAKVDQTVFNPARLIRVAGTLCAKGDSTPDRPHRMSKLLEVPEPLDFVPDSRLRTLVQTAGAEASTSGRSHATAPRNEDFDLDTFIASHFPGAKAETWGDGGTRWIVDPCPFNSDHRGTSAAILRTESGVIAFRCQHNGCADRGWKDVRAMFDQPSEGAGGKMSAATLLVELASSCRKFHSPDRTAYVDLEQDGHRETWKVRSSGFRQWLKKEFWHTHESAPSGQAMTDAIGVIESMAIFDGDEIPVHLRMAELGGETFLDLCDPEWRAVKIDASGWTVVSNPPVRFRRESGMLTLPEPVAGGSLEPLRKLLHVAGDAWVLLVAWVVGSFNPKMPLAVLVLVGPQGATKSTRTRLLRGLFDPHVAPLRSLPRDERDLVIAANRNYALCVDNVSHLPVWLSDALCRVSTGGGFGTRELYTDADEIVFNSLRPIVLNGIEQFATRGDLLDRSFVIELDALPEHLRREEREVRAEYEEALPGLLGALLNGVSSALRNRNKVTVEKLPRMADFARWVTAAEEGLGFEHGAFLQALRRNKAETHDLAVEASPIGTAICALIGRRRNGWTGTATQLLEALADDVREEARRARSWPKNAKVLADVLRRIVPDLAALGITVTFHKRDREGRLISIERQDPRRIASLSSPASEPAPSGDSVGDENRDEELVEALVSSRDNPLTDEGGDERDASDADEEDS